MYNVDFGNNGILTINAPKATEQDNNEIELTADTKQTTVTNAAAATLNVITDFQVRDATWSTVGITNISDGVHPINLLLMQVVILTFNRQAAK